MILPFFMLMSCGDDAAADSAEADKGPVKLETFKDKISYTLGTMEAKKITESPNPGASKMDKKMLLVGFKEGYKTGVNLNPEDPCMKTIESLFGFQGTNYDSTYVIEGSKCYGSKIAGMFYKQLEEVFETQNINQELVFRGFEDALAGKDGALTDEEKIALVEEFSKQVSAKMEAKMQGTISNIAVAEAAQWEEIKAMDGIVELEGGVYIKTVKAGSGVFPTATDDVEASYIVSRLDGSVKQNSADFGGTFKTNLGSVVEGWTIGFQSMQKGGKYMLYVPAELAYREETLIFEIEVFDVGPAGTIAEPR